MNLDLEGEKIRKVFNAFTDCLKNTIDDYVSGRVKMHLPRIPVDLVVTILDKVTRVFKAEEVVLDIKSPIMIIGDLHGQLLDLFRILKRHSDWENTQFLFLGDLVDRGSFSTETVLLVFLMKVLYPDTVHIIRGNHEFAEIYNACGFSTELRGIYKEAPMLLSLFEVAFSFMPLAAVIDNEILCVHGGIGPTVNTIDDIRREVRPQTVFAPGPMDDVLWSDPDDRLPMFTVSRRGSGHCFGREAFAQFLNRNKLKCLIRGHQCVDSGVQEKFDGRLVTVFSASNYCGITNNKGGVFIIQEDGNTEGELFPPIPYFARERVVFDAFEHGEEESEPSEVHSGFTTPKRTAQSSRLPAIKNSRQWSIPRPSVKKPESRDNRQNAARRPPLSSLDVRGRGRRGSVGMAVPGRPPKPIML